MSCTVFVAAAGVYAGYSKKGVNAMSLTVLTLQPGLGGVEQKGVNAKSRTAFVAVRPGVLNPATTYSPTFYRSTIGADGLNFSVRNGKRWTPSL